VESGRITPDSIIGTLGGGNRFAVSRDSVWFVEERRVTASETAKGIGKVTVALLGALTLALLGAMSAHD
jgi:hypothetical protein